MEKWFLTDNSATNSRILMIFSADMTHMEDMIVRSAWHGKQVSLFDIRIPDRGLSNMGVWEFGHSNKGLGSHWCGGWVSLIPELGLPDMAGKTWGSASVHLVQLPSVATDSRTG